MDEEESGTRPFLFQDVETATRWDLLGRALAGGELESHKLEQVPAHNSMWFAWDTYWRGAPVWEGEGIIDTPETAIAEDDGTMEYVEQLETDFDEETVDDPDSLVAEVEDFLRNQPGT